MKIISNNFVLLIFFSTTIFAFSQTQGTLISDMNTLRWEKVLPGVWKASFGESGLNPFDYSAPSQTNAIKNLGEAPFPFDVDSTFYQLTNERATIRLPLSKTESIYGMGLEFNGLNRRGNVYTLKVDHYGGTMGYTHAPIPFYVSSEGYGVLINSSKRIKIYVGTANRKDGKQTKPIDRTTNPRDWEARPAADAIEASVQGSGLEIYIFGGITPLESVQRYNLFCGGGILPPKWGLGFWHRTPTAYSDEDIYQEIKEFEENRFPLHVIGLEPGWQNFAYPCSYDWSEERFPNPKEFLRNLKNQDIEVNLWENPYVAPTSSLADKIKPYVGSHTVWHGTVPDYSIPEARKILMSHHQKEHIDLGISGYKIDEVDGYDFWLWPDHASFPSGNDPVEIRQLYGLMIQKEITDHFKQQNKRTYGLVRSSYIGSPSQNFVIYSDYYGHKGYVTALSNSSLAGVLWTPEIRDAKSPEEWVRRFQSVCYSPMLLLNAWASKTKPWDFEGVTDIIRENVETRLKLLPYLYTAFYNYNQQGIPPFRAMVLEKGYLGTESLSDGALDDVKNPYAEKTKLEVTDQYMMGPSILVAPFFTGQTKRDVILPKGNWYDFYTGELVGNGNIITVAAKLEQIPLFVKDGGIIPMLASTDIFDEQNLEVRHYGQKQNHYLLYNDDGVSYNFEGGDFSLIQLQAFQDKNGKLKGKVKNSNSKDYRYNSINWIWMTY